MGEPGEDAELWISQINAILRRLYQVDPDALSDAEWIKLYNEFLYTEKIKRKLLKETFQEALEEVLSKIKM